jgi:co-chaperonin GroES (HSP10)
MASKYLPHNGYIVVRVQKQKKTGGGIVLPEGHGRGDKLLRGVVEAVGRPRKSDFGIVLESGIRVDDRVVFTTYTQPLEEDADSILYAANQDDVIAFQVNPEEVAK